MLKAKIRKIGTGYGILIPRKNLEEINAREGDEIVVKRMEKPVREIKGILKGTGLRFQREAEDRDLDEASQE